MMIGTINHANLNIIDSDDDVDDNYKKNDNGDCTPTSALKGCHLSR